MRIAGLLFTAVVAASPASATGGLTCATAGLRPVVVSVGFGHVPGAPLVASQLVDAGARVAVTPAQWWLDNREVRLLLVSADALRTEVTIRAKRNGHHYDGSLWRAGKRRWVRCRES